MDATIKNAPERIYLCLGEDLPGEAIEFHELHDVTWCADKQDANDIEYVLAALPSDAAQAPVAWMLQEPGQSKRWYTSGEAAMQHWVSKGASAAPLYASPVAPAAQVTDEMVSRFLGWHLPDDFAPDCGVSFKPLGHPNGWPIGTNLFTATQARAMLEHVLATQDAPTAAARERDDPQIIEAANKAYAAGLADGKVLGALAAQPDEDATKEIDVLHAKLAQERARNDRAVAILSHIYGLLTPEDVRLTDGRVMRFDNAELEREMFRGLCAAIRAIPAAQPMTPESTADAIDATFRRRLELRIQNLTVSDKNEITWLSISCRGVEQSLYPRKTSCS